MSTTKRFGLWMARFLAVLVGGSLFLGGLAYLIHLAMPGALADKFAAAVIPVAFFAAIGFAKKPTAE